MRGNMVRPETMLFEGWSRANHVILMSKEWFSPRKGEPPNRSTWDSWSCGPLQHSFAVSVEHTQQHERETADTQQRHMPSVSSNAQHKSSQATGSHAHSLCVPRLRVSALTSSGTDYKRASKHWFEGRSRLLLPQRFKFDTE